MKVTSTVLGYNRNMPDDAEKVTPENEPDEQTTDGVWDPDELVDEMSQESFPTSDPPSTWAGEDHG